MKKIKRFSKAHYDYLRKYSEYDPLDLAFLNEVYNNNSKYSDLKIKINILVN